MRKPDVSAGLEPNSFATFYRKEYPGAVRLAWLLTRSESASEDLVQDAFASIHDRFEDLDSPGGYLRTTLVNRCRRWHRSNGREAARLRIVHTDDPHHGGGGSELIDVLATLPYRQRAVLVLRFWAGYTEAEIAETLGCRPGTVKSLASRALARIRTEISP